MRVCNEHKKKIWNNITSFNTGHSNSLSLTLLHGSWKHPEYHLVQHEKCRDRGTTAVEHASSVTARTNYLKKQIAHSLKL